MQKIRNIPIEYLLLIAIILALVIVLYTDLKTTKKSERTTGTSQSATLPTKRIEKEEGSVTVAIEYLPEKSDDKKVTFQIVLDTHSVNLDSFGFQKDIIPTPTKVSESGGGHHRKAEVSFQKTSNPFTVTIKDIANIPKREFNFSI